MTAVIHWGDRVTVVFLVSYVILCVRWLLHMDTCLLSKPIAGHVRPSLSGTPMLPRQDCFGKAPCWHWHRLVAGQRSAGLSGEKEVDSSRVFFSEGSAFRLASSPHPFFKNRFNCSIPSVCLHTASLQGHNRSPERASAAVSTSQG